MEHEHNLTGCQPVGDGLILRSHRHLNNHRRLSVAAPPRHNCLISGKAENLTKVLHSTGWCTTSGVNFLGVCSIFPHPNHAPETPEDPADPNRNNRTWRVIER